MLGILAVRINIKSDLLQVLRHTRNRSLIARQHLTSGSQMFENEKQEVVLWIMQKKSWQRIQENSITLVPRLRIHFKCSGLTDSKDYHDNFLCSHCRESRNLLDDEKDGDYAAVFPKIHDHYTNPRKKSAFGSRRSLIKASKFRSKDVDRYLDSSKTYTKFKLTRKRFPRLKVISYRLNKIWSIDLADMQKLANSNTGIRYLFVAVDVLSCYLWVEPINLKTAHACREALKKILAKHDRNPKFAVKHISQKKFGLTRVVNFRANLLLSAVKRELRFIPPKLRQNVH